MTSSKNKIQIIITKELLSAAISLRSCTKLIITSMDPTPTQVHLGLQTQRVDLKTTHEEADIIIPMQAKAAISEGRTDILVFTAMTPMYSF